MKGGPVEWDQIFRLRHFSLGKYVAVEKEQDTDIDTDSCFNLEDKQNDNSLLQFSDSDSSIVMLRLKDNCKNYDVLKFYKANLNEIQETSFLVSYFPIMKKTLSILTDLATKDYKKIYQDKNIKFSKKITSLKKVLQDLTRFCSNQFLISSLNRQNVLEEQYFINILIVILYKKYLDLIRKKKRLWIYGYKYLDQQFKNYILQLFKQMTDFVQVAQRIQSDNDKKQLQSYIGEKFEVIKMIYQLLICIWKDNYQKEEYVQEKLLQTVIVKKRVLSIQEKKVRSLNYNQIQQNQQKTLIQFDVINLINRKYIYSEILQPLITFLEYDKNNYILFYLMNFQREEALKRAKNSNKLISTMKGIVTGAIDVGRAIVNVFEEEFAIKDSKSIEFNFFNDGQDKDKKQHQSYKQDCKLIDLLLQKTQGEESYKLNTPKLKQIFSLRYLVNLGAEENDEFIEGYCRNGTKDAI
ncbi:unnamed protein product [Paramecium sonneborni]|uniref:Uncharacterized protein n=1 Tax=Paramecium sonneborni TaxID=65129 RepID=A0A8S1R1R0_9CILI|nr:unnamed protein product [Paramecium sonneborni]